MDYAHIAARDWVSVAWEYRLRFLRLPFTPLTSYIYIYIYIYMHIHIYIGHVLAHSTTVAITMRSTRLAPSLQAVNEHRQVWELKVRPCIKTSSFSVLFLPHACNPRHLPLGCSQRRPLRERKTGSGMH